MYMNDEDIKLCISFAFFFFYTFVVKKDILETFDTHLDNIYALAIAFISSFWGDKSITILLSMMYMLLCLSIKHLPYWEFLFMHPFSWSIIHDVHIDQRHYISLASMGQVTRFAQEFIPAQLHFQISIGCSIVVYLLAHKLCTISTVERYVTAVNWYYVLLHIMYDLSFLMLLDAYRFEFTITQIVLSVLYVGLIKYVHNNYAKCILVYGVYLVHHWIPIPMIITFNQCVTLGLKEELYHSIQTSVFIRFNEHAVAFLVFYTIRLLDLSFEFEFYFFTTLLCITQCTLVYLHNSYSLDELPI